MFLLSCVFVYMCCFIVCMDACSVTYVFVVMLICACMLLFAAAESKKVLTPKDLSLTITRQLDNEREGDRSVNGTVSSRWG